jgi:hypothetical protein
VLQDHLKGRYSEVDLINGLVVEEASRRGKAAPANAVIVELTRRIQDGTLKPDPSNLALAQEMLAPVRGTSARHGRARPGHPDSESSVPASRDRRNKSGDDIDE